jgi:hypothetical protein
VCVVGDIFPQPGRLRKPADGFLTENNLSGISFRGDQVIHL